MKRWLIVTKETDYGKEDTPNDWIDLEEKKELTFYVDKKLKKGDWVLIYKSGQWRVISHIFEVKNNPYKKDGNYRVHLHRKKQIPKPLTLSELKENGIIKENRKFRRRVYEIPLRCWSEIIGFIAEKNPKLLDPFEPKFCSGPNKRGYPIKLKKDLIELINKTKKYNIGSFNEEATKYLIILPLLEKLGWNIYDPWEVYPENPISDRKVDYILKDCNFNQICIEAKKANEEDLDQHKNQIFWYCASKNVDLGILTSGILWKFYFFYYYENSLGAIKKIEGKEINILKERSEKCADNFIEYFWKGNTSKRNPKESEDIKDLIKAIKSIDENFKYIYNESAVKQFIVMPLLKNLGWDIFNPSEIIFDHWINRKKIDYILKDGKDFKLCIEVKSMGSDLDYDAEGNILQYASDGNFDLSILTDGNDWRFYYFKKGIYHEDFKFKICENNTKWILDIFKYILSKNRVFDSRNLKYLEEKVINRI